MKQMRAYSGIDAFRLLAAFCVVGLHVSYGNLNNGLVVLLQRFDRFAVPFFFMVSGFFWRIDSAQKFKSLFVKLASIIVVSNLIYLIVDFQPDKSIVENIKILLLGAHLWFLNALLIGAAFMYYVGFRINRRLMAFVALLIYFGYCLMVTYKLVDTTIAGLVSMRMFIAIPFLFAGHLIRANETRLKTISMPVTLAITSVGFLLLCAESILMYKWGFAISPYATEFNFSLLLFAFGMFLCALKTNSSGYVAKLGQEHSLFVYLYHPLIIGFYGMLVTRTLPQPLQHYAYWLSGIMVFMLTLALSLLLSRLLPFIFHLLNGRIQRENLQTANA